VNAVNFFQTWIFLLGEGSSDEGVKKSEAVNWYLEQIEEDINTQEELLDKKLIVEKVVHRLIHKVGFCKV